MLSYISLLILASPCSSQSIYNDLYSHYQDSQEIPDPEPESELLLDNVQALVSVILNNVSQICPHNQPQDFFHSTGKVLRSTLAHIYESPGGKKLQALGFYNDMVTRTYALLHKCVDSRTKISREILLSEKIIHQDLKSHFAANMTKWQNFRSCTRLEEKSTYPAVIPMAIETLWQSFLLGYFGCQQYYNSVDTWRFADIVQDVILLPVIQHWQTIFPKRQTLSLLNTKSQNFNTMPSTDTLLLLERCNALLYMKNPVDPIPCLKTRIATDKDNTFNYNA